MEPERIVPYSETPREIRNGQGLIKTLTDINGNEFSSNNRTIGSVLSIDYPPCGIIVIDYKIELTPNRELHWKQIRKRKWIYDTKYKIGGKWQDIRD